MSIKTILRTLTPGFWLMNYPYSRALDSFISKSLDDGHEPQRVNKYYVKLAGKDIWVQNWPYAYGTIRDARPSRATICRLRDAIEDAEFRLTSAAL